MAESEVNLDGHSEMTGAWVINPRDQPKPIFTSCQSLGPHLSCIYYQRKPCWWCLHCGVQKQLLWMKYTVILGITRSDPLVIPYQRNKICPQTTCVYTRNQKVLGTIYTTRIWFLNLFPVIAFFGRLSISFNYSRDAPKTKDICQKKPRPLAN